MENLRSVPVRTIRSNHFCARTSDADSTLDDNFVDACTCYVLKLVTHLLPGRSSIKFDSDRNVNNAKPAFPLTFAPAKNDYSALSVTSSSK